MLEPRPELLDRLAALENCPPDLHAEILSIDERARDLEDLYKIHTTSAPERHRVDLRVYVNGRPTGSGVLVISAGDEYAAELLSASAVEAVVRKLQPELDELYQTWCAKIRGELIPKLNEQKGAQTND